MSRLKKEIIRAFNGQPQAHRGWVMVMRVVQAHVKGQKAKAWEQGALFQREDQLHLRHSNPYTIKEENN